MRHMYSRDRARLMRRALPIASLAASALVASCKRQERDTSRTRDSARLETEGQRIWERTLAALDGNPTLAGFVEAVAPAFGDNYTLLHNPRGSLSGTWSNPRVILFSDDARLLVSYSTKPGSDTIEALAWDDAVKHYTPHRFRLKGPAWEKETAPKACASCHGAKARAIWDPYPFWPESYGTQKNGLNAEVSKSHSHILEVEKVNIGKLAALWAAQPLLSPLKLPSADPAHLQKAFAETNSRFTQALLTLNFERLSAINVEEGLPPVPAPSGSLRHLKDIKAAELEFANAKLDALQLPYYDDLASRYEAVYFDGTNRPVTKEFAGADLLAARPDLGKYAVNRLGLISYQRFLLAQEKGVSLDSWSTILLGGHRGAALTPGGFVFTRPKDSIGANEGIAD